MQGEYITAKEAGKRLGVGRQRIYDLIHAGRLKATWDDETRSYRIDPESVKGFKRLPPGPKPKSST